jgi:hypothetical protein
MNINVNPLKPHESLSMHQRQQMTRANHAVYDPIFIQYIIIYLINAFTLQHHSQFPCGALQSWSHGERKPFVQDAATWPSAPPRVASLEQKSNLRTGEATTGAKAVSGVICPLGLPQLSQAAVRESIQWLLWGDANGRGERDTVVIASPQRSVDPATNAVCVGVGEEKSLACAGHVQCFDKGSHAVRVTEVIAEDTMRLPGTATIG